MDKRSVQIHKLVSIHTNQKYVHSYPNICKGIGKGRWRNECESDRTYLPCSHITLLQLPKCVMWSFEDKNVKLNLTRFSTYNSMLEEQVKCVLSLIFHFSISHFLNKLHNCTGIIVMNGLLNVLNYWNGNITLLILILFIL